MKKRLLAMLLVVLLCALAGCGDDNDQMQNDNDKTTTTTTVTQASAPLTMVEGKIPADCLWCPDPTAIAQKHVVMLKANRDLTDLRFLTLNPDPPTTGETIYTYPSLTEGRVVSFYTYLSDTIPNRGVACTDAEGKTYYYAFTYSGKDGSISLTELNIAPLSEERLTEIETYLNDAKNNGFVSMNEYTCPEEVSLFSALYDGAGIGVGSWEWTDEEAQDYIVAAEWEEFYVSVLRFARADVEALLQKKLGISIADLTQDIDMLYIEKYDAYYHAHSDTQYQAVEVLSGWLEGGEGGLCVVDYKTRQSESFDYERRRVTLRLTKDGYQFVSNMKIDQTGQTVAPLTLMHIDAPEGSYWHVDATVESTNYTVVLRADTDLTNLCFLELGADEPVVEQTLHVRSSLKEGEYWAIETYVNDAVPNRGIACTDKDGKIYYYAITWSGKGDGYSISLTELNVPSLSKERLTEIETYLNDVENNGFVSMNEYSRPEEVSLHDALYNGAGIGVRDWSEEEKQEYMKITGQTDEEEAFLWPIFRFPRADLEALILKKLGIPLSEFELPMTYIEELDAYFTSHTDSSYQTVEVLHGWLEGGEGGLFVVSYKLAWGKIGHVTLRLTKDGYQFVSNRYTAE